MHRNLSTSRCPVSRHVAAGLVLAVWLAGSLAAMENKDDRPPARPDARQTPAQPPQHVRVDVKVDAAGQAAVTITDGKGPPVVHSVEVIGPDGRFALQGAATVGGGQVTVQNLQGGPATIVVGNGVIQVGPGNVVAVPRGQAGGATVAFAVSADAGLPAAAAGNDAGFSVDLQLERLRSDDQQARMTAARLLASSRDPRVLSALIEAARDASADVRRFVASGLGRFGDRRATAALVSLLADKDLGVRRAAAAALRNLADPASLNALLTTLENDKDREVLCILVPAVRDLAAGCPADLQARVVAAFSGLLEHEDVAVRQASVAALAAFDAVPADLWLKVLKTASDATTEWRAIRGLAKSKDPRSFEHFLKALASPYENVRLAAVEGLGGLARPEAIEPLAALAAGDETGPELLAAIEDALVRIARAGAADRVLRMLDAPASRQRAAAAKVCGEIRDTRSVGRLLGFLQTDELCVRLASVDALGKLGDRRAVRPIKDLLADDDYPALRQAALVALGRLGDADAAETVVGALDDADIDVRERAAEAVASFGDAATGPLIVMLARGSPRARASAAQILGAMGRPEAAGPLAAATGDADPAVRESAVAALARFKDAQSVERLKAALRDADPRVRRASADALGLIGDACALDALVAALGDGDWRVRRAAAEALGRIGDPRAAKALEALHGDPHWYVRRTADEATKALAGGQLPPRPSAPATSAEGPGNP